MVFDPHRSLTETLAQGEIRTEDVLSSLYNGAGVEGGVELAMDSGNRKVDIPVEEQSNVIDSTNSETVLVG